MSSHESASEYARWQAHARTVQVEAITDQIFASLEAESYVGIPVSLRTAEIIQTGFSGGQVDLSDILGKYGEEPSEVLNLLEIITKRNALLYQASQLRFNCGEEVGIREWNVRTALDSFWEFAVRAMMGGHRNEPIYDTIGNGWDKGTLAFLSAIEGEMPLLPYTKKLLQNMPVRVERSIIGEEMFYAGTKIPNVHVKYWYSELQDRPNMAVKITPFE